MLDPLQAVRDRLGLATSARKKGDALRKVGREDAALDAYRAGVAALTEALALLEPVRATLDGATRPDEGPLHELVETLGALGGMHQRIGQTDAALDAYLAGAELEQRFQLKDTYNRLNALKQKLVLGRCRLREVDADLIALAALIETNLRADKLLSDRGWAWADLGDCLALLGKAADARQAYATFIAKAEIKSPARTLDVLRQVAAALGAHGDPDAARVSAAVAVLEQSLATAS